VNITGYAITQGLAHMYLSAASTVRLVNVSVYSTTGVIATNPTKLNIASLSASQQNCTTANTIIIQLSKPETSFSDTTFVVYLTFDSY
jgi:hypothetical protein